jgi:hypothetical protein
VTHEIEAGEVVIDSLVLLDSGCYWRRALSDFVDPRQSKVRDVLQQSLTRLKELDHGKEMPTPGSATESPFKPNLTRSLTWTMRVR